ncbi:MAG TPA: hypothetical protein VGE01_04455 [Fimbriimonas sp.]
MLKRAASLALVGLSCISGAQTNEGFGGGGFGAGRGQPLGNSPALDKPVTFRGTVSLRELPAFLIKLNVDFVIADTERLPDRKLTMNINGKPLRDVLLAVGHAVNGSWVGSGEVFALQIHLPPHERGFPPPPIPGVRR